jgi:flagellar motility protein MotE (MotC chaperone)
MVRILQANWMVALIGSLAYLTSTMLFLPGPGYWKPPLLDGEELLPAAVPSWEYRNPDLDRMLEDAKDQHARLEQRARELQELEIRLNAERAELAVATQAVVRLQKAYDESVVRFQEAEVANLKRLAKTHAAMSPEGSANILKELSDDEITRILALLKPDQAGPILEAFGRGGKEEARRAAVLSDRLRRSLPPEGS